MNELLAGTASPTLDWLQRVAAALDVDPVKLLHGEPGKIPSRSKRAQRAKAR